MKKIFISAHSDKGDVRQENQDSFLCKCAKIGTHKAGLFIVADGCGGLSDGAQISSMITAGFSRFWNTDLNELLQHRHIAKNEVNAMLDSKLEEINKEAYEFGAQTGSRVGSTISLLLVIDDVFYIRNIGDSRIYRIRHRIKQLTEDQTFVADMVRRGELRPEEAAFHKKRNLLSMCIGAFRKLRIYSVSGRIWRNDHYIICCDGFYNYLNMKKIRRTLCRCKGKNFDGVARDMRAMIEEGTARDNVTVIAVRFKGSYW